MAFYTDDNVSEAICVMPFPFSLSGRGSDTHNRMLSIFALLEAGLRDVKSSSTQI